jgi:3-(3-hydroxy-phenyl)propionate hydroxylase
VSVSGYRLPVFPFTRPPELAGQRPGRYPVVVVGAGLTGLTLAAELGRRGIPVVLLEQGASLGVIGIASRGIAYAKRTLEIFDRIGIADRVREKGQTWNEGSVHVGLEELYRYQLEAEADQKWPAFINLQQFYVEQFLVERILELGNVDLRWQSRVIGARADDDGVELEVLTPEGSYQLTASWLAACDGAGSAVRRSLGIRAPLAQLEDTWAIVDVKVEMPGLQRRIYLDSPLIEGGAIVMHPMADGVVRADWQIGQLTDPDAEIEPDRVRARLASFLGDEAAFDVVSISRWSYRRRVMERLLHARAAFLGDAAHEIPPFGARGGNGGIQDAENLAWKLEAVLRGRTSPALLETFDHERGQAALENARLACRSQAFITPRSRPARVLRDAVVSLAREHEFARAWVNTGRPSTPTRYRSTPLAVADSEPFGAGPGPGAAAPDGPLDGGFLLDLRGDGFLAVHFRDAEAPTERREEVRGFSLEHVVVPRRPDTSVLLERWGVHEDQTYVLRPDSHVLGRIRGSSAQAARELVAQGLDQADRP